MSPPPPRPTAPPFSLKPTHKAVRGYYLALAQLANVGAAHESAVRAAFDALIEAAAGPLGWTLVREYAVSRKGAAPLKLDGVLLDGYRIPHGVLEAKDDADDLAAEMRAKLKLGYPAKNTLFWQPRDVTSLFRATLSDSLGQRKDPDHERQKTHDRGQDPHLARG
jgi:hypothetical protein